MLATAQDSSVTEKRAVDCHIGLFCIDLFSCWRVTSPVNEVGEIVRNTGEVACVYVIGFRIGDN